VLSFFLQKENVRHWTDVQNLVNSSNIEAADKTLRQYVLEAQRFTSAQRDIRICAGRTTVDGQVFNPGDLVICLFVCTK
jgi:hypothetical protein